jgi:hypothetical protein
MPCVSGYNVCQSTVVFQGLNSISDDLLLNITEANFKTFFDWAFLDLGAWFDAEIDEYSIYSSGVQQSQLLPVADEAYEDGQVWQGIRKDWVYETGCSANGTEPIAISGLYIGSTFYPYPGGDFAVNYPDGRIIFDSPISISSNVKMNYSYRNVQIYRASDAPWFNMIQYGSFNNSDIDIQRMEDGNWSIAGNHRIQLPAIIIEPISRSQSMPYEIGSRQLVISQDIGFYIVAETKNERNKLLDILRLQQGMTIQLYDTNEVAQNEVYPLGPTLDINPSGLMYPDLVSQYPYRKCYLRNINLFEIESLTPYFHQGLARATVEIIS